MTSGVSAGLGILLTCEALLLAASVATVLPAVRDGIEGAEGRIVERITDWRDRIEPVMAQAFNRVLENLPQRVAATAPPPEPLPEEAVDVSAAEAAQDAPPIVTGSVPPAVVEVPREASSEPAPETAPVAVAPVEPAPAPVRDAAPSPSPPSPPAPVIALAPPEAPPPPLREFAPPRAPLAPTPTPPAPAQRPSEERAAPTPSAAPPPPPPTSQRSLEATLDKPGPGEIAGLQQRLIQLGLLRGEADGVAGEITLTALWRYLERHRLNPSLGLDALFAHMDRSIDGGRSPAMSTENFLIGRDFAPELRAELTRADLQTARTAIVHALSSLERGYSYAAFARRGGASFVVTPVSGDPFDRCRRFTLTIHTQGREQTGRGIRACRVGPSWQLSDG